MVSFLLSMLISPEPAVPLLFLVLVYICPSIFLVV